MFMLMDPVPDKFAVAVAPEPPPPEIVTLGGCLYPDPGFVNVSAVTSPFRIVAVAVAGVPLAGGDMVTVGAEVYPDPLESNFNEVTIDVLPCETVPDAYGMCQYPLATNPQTPKSVTLLEMLQKPPDTDLNEYVQNVVKHETN
jgi:hypothetical protein